MNEGSAKENKKLKEKNVKNLNLNMSQLKYGHECKGPLPN
jgi:hypothetical protein